MSRPGGARILVVDDEPALLDTVRRTLARHGFQPLTAPTGQQALARYRADRPDLLLLDLGLPDLDGLEVIRHVRGHSALPIIVLSARETEADKVRALDLGADDYLTKPFGAGELLARVRVALRHAAHPAAGAAAIFRAGELEVDLERRLVSVAGREVRLTPTEYALLQAFIAAPNRVLTDRALLRRVWGPEYGEEDHYLHVYIARLRKKLAGGTAGSGYLVTEPGVGYRLLADDR